MQRLGAIIFLAIAFGLLTGAGLMVRSSLDFLKRARPVQAVVVEVRGGPRPDGDYQEQAVLDWTAADGRTRQHSLFSAREHDFERGQRFDFLYDPSALEDGLKTAAFDRWLAPAVLSFFGVVFSGIAIKVLLKG